MNRCLRAMSAVFALGCTAALAADALPQGFTCCNLHYNKDWISDANWSSYPMIPAGTPIKVIDYGWNRASVEIDGKAFRIGHDYGRNEESLEKYVAKLVVPASPKAKIDRYPEKVRAAIHAGKVIPGMTREQAIIAVSYPPTHRTRTLEEPVWNVWTSTTRYCQIHWNAKGAVEKLAGDC